MGEGPSNGLDAYIKEVDDLLAFEYGSEARIRRLNMPESGPVAEVIGQAMLSVPADFRTVWISHSLPEVATYKVSGAPFPIICHSQDHTFYYDKVRWLFNPTMEEAVVGQCSYMLYKIIGEFAIKYSDIDKALLIYTSALYGNPIYRPDLDRYGTMLPFSDNHLIDLVFLLNHLHEVGHNRSFQERFASLPPDHLLAEASLLDMIHDVLYPSLYPETIKGKAEKLARSSEGGCGFSLAQLKEEIVADFLAADGFLLYLKLTAGHDQKLAELLREYAIYPFLVGVIQRCKFIAQLLGDTGCSKAEKRLRADLRDIAIRVRIHALLQWQHQVLHRFLGSPRTGIAHQALVAEMLDEVQRSVNRAAVTINSELRKVREHCIQLQEEPNGLQEMEWRKQLLLNPVTRIELDEFCRKAESFKKSSPLLQYLIAELRK